MKKSGLLALGFTLLALIQSTPAHARYGFAWANGEDGNAHCYPADDDGNIPAGVSEVDAELCAGSPWGNVIQSQPSCTGNNVFGTYADGGGCNAFGCYYPGGDCNAFGCYYSGGSCDAFGCVNASAKTTQACE